MAKKYKFELLPGAGDHTDENLKRYSTKPGKRCIVPSNDRLDIMFPRKFKLLEGAKFKSDDDEAEPGVYDDGLSHVKQSDGGMLVELPPDVDPDEIEETQVEAQKLQKEQRKLAAKAEKAARPKTERDSDDDESEEEEGEGPSAKKKAAKAKAPARDGGLAKGEKDVTSSFKDAKNNDLTVVKNKDGLFVRDGNTGLHEKGFKTTTAASRFIAKHLKK